MPRVAFWMVLFSERLYHYVRAQNGAGAPSLSLSFCLSTLSLWRFSLRELPHHFSVSLLCFVDSYGVLLLVIPITDIATSGSHTQRAAAPSNKPLASMLFSMQTNFF